MLRNFIKIPDNFLTHMYSVNFVYGQFVVTNGNYQAGMIDQNKLKQVDPIGNTPQKAIKYSNTMYILIHLILNIEITIHIFYMFNSNYFMRTKLTQ